MWKGCQGLDWLVLVERSRVVRGFRSGCLCGMVVKDWIGLFLLNGQGLHWLDWLVLVERSRDVRGFRSGCLCGMVVKGCIGWIGLFLLYLVEVSTNVVIRFSLLMCQLLGFYIF